MRDALAAELRTRLTAPEFGGRINGDYIQKIACPDCHQREAYTRAAAPWLLACGRLNRCGARIHVKTLFPEVFDDWSRRYQPPPGAPAEPNAVAEGYLREGRGFDLALIRGTYSQEYFVDTATGAATATVRFTLPGGATWERLLDRPERFGPQKANFRGTYAGEAWSLQTEAELAAAGEVWIVEGIFDAIALAHAGVAALSAMTCANFPGTALARLAAAARAAEAPAPTLVWALDNNAAGREATARHSERARELDWTNACAQPPSGCDWNDCWQRGLLDAADIERYRYHGALFQAPTPTDKAALMVARHPRREFWFEHGRRLYWLALPADKLDAALAAVTGETDAEARAPSPQAYDAAVRQAAQVSRICSAAPTALYYQANPVTDEAWYYFRIDSPDGASVQNTFNGSQLASAAEFKKRLMNVAAGAIWSGTSGQLDRVLADQFGSIRTVETVDFVGYAREHGAWLLGDIAVAGGRVYHRSRDDYFDFGRTRLKTLARAPELCLNPRLEEFDTDWLDALAGAFGDNGVVALAYWLGALFAEQIRAAHKSFPFLEIIGEAGAGKSTLIEFLWKTVGRGDYEGFDPTKASLPARARNFAQVANLPVVLNESDRELDGGNRAKQFDWDELKTAYNGRNIRARGVKNGGNETYEPPFRGAIVIAQNAEVAASQAIQTRICHLCFTKAGQTQATKTLAESLERTPIERVSGFAIRAARHEQTVLRLVSERTPRYEAELFARDEIRVLRIAKNHAQLLALVDALGPEGLGLIGAERVAAASARVQAMAGERQHAINADHPLVEEFWEAVAYIESCYQGTALNHYGPHDERIAINLKEFESLCGQHRLTGVPPIRELKRYLYGSKSRPFIDSNVNIRSRLRANHASVRCWVFQRRAGR